MKKGIGLLLTLFIVLNMMQYIPVSATGTEYTIKGCITKISYGYTMNGLLFEDGLHYRLYYTTSDVSNLTKGKKYRFLFENDWMIYRIIQDDNGVELKDIVNYEYSKIVINGIELMNLQGQFCSLVMPYIVQYKDFGSYKIIDSIKVDYQYGMLYNYGSESRFGEIIYSLLILNQFNEKEVINLRDLLSYNNSILYLSSHDAMQEFENKYGSEPRYIEYALDNNNKICSLNVLEQYSSYQNVVYDEKTNTFLGKDIVLSQQIPTFYQPRVNGHVDIDGCQSLKLIDGMTYDINVYSNEGGNVLVDVTYAYKKEYAFYTGIKFISPTGYYGYGVRMINGNGKEVEYETAIDDDRVLLQYKNKLVAFELNVLNQIISINLASDGIPLNGADYLPKYNTLLNATSTFRVNDETKVIFFNEERKPFNFTPFTLEPNCKYDVIGYQIDNSQTPKLIVITNINGNYNHIRNASITPFNDGYKLSFSLIDIDSGTVYINTYKENQMQSSFVYDIKSNYEILLSNNFDNVKIMVLDDNLKPKTQEVNLKITN